LPTYDQTDRFKKDLKGLTETQRTRFKAAVEKFIEDLKAGRPPRASLGIERLRSDPDLFEFHFEGDGRATFQFGAEILPGEKHVIWRRVGTHDVYRP
jgi:mRNA-degrading endonuclease YafQ of YafQ-DinJ toxin-antitoxin module